MRPELEMIALIERYLLKELDEADMREFDKRFESNSTFRQEVELQRQLMDGINRLSLKISVQKAGKIYKWTKLAWQAGLGLLGAAVVAAAFVIFTNRSTEEAPAPDTHPIVPMDSVVVDTIYTPEGDTQMVKTVVPKTTPQAESPKPIKEVSRWIEAGRYIPSQNFEIRADKGNVIETKGGLVMAIPADAFVDENGSPISGAIQLEVKEALDPVTIIKAGLSTVSNGDLLETGGMFYINATQAGKSLQMDPKAKMLVEIPTDSTLEGMQLFDGEGTEDGRINWVRPQPQEQYLSAVNIHQLDFYPPTFRRRVARSGLDATDKPFVDSLFYSFTCEEMYERYYDERTQLRFDNVREEGRRGRRRRAIDDGEWVQAEQADSAYIRRDPAVCPGVNPSNIRAIWNDRFQNTNLSTKEFEERLKYIYQSCKDGILDLYVNNLDLPFYKVDSMVALRMTDKKMIRRFERFSKRRDGRVKVEDALVGQLSAYYSEKSRIFEAAANKTIREYWAEQRRLDTEATSRRIAYGVKERKRNLENYQKELNLNLDEAYRQLGQDRPRNIVASNRRYRFPMRSTGWKNVDRYVISSLNSRTTLNYTSKDGRKAVIEYEELRVKVDELESYDRVNAYLVTKELYSFMRMREMRDGFRENLNELIEYNMVCVGFNGDERGFFSVEQVEPGKIDIALGSISNTELENSLASLCKQRDKNDLLEDLAYQSFEIADAQRRLYNNEIRQIRRVLYRTVFRCSSITDRFGDQIPARSRR